MPAFRTIMGIPRSPAWGRVRKEFLAEHPECAACGGRHHREAHHLKPYHLWPDLELDPANLLTLCRSCHFVFGHLHDWTSFNPNAVADCIAHFQAVCLRPGSPKNPLTLS
jgi:5-methylcytosine-specific restriction enzyme A